MVRTRWMGLASLAVVVLACSKAEAPAGEGAPKESAAQAVAPEEIEPLKAKLDAAMAANADRSCHRSVLRGEPTPGPADAAVRAIMEPSAALQMCFDAVGRDADDLVEPCAALPAAVRAAVAHEDACSPYLLGRNPAPDSLTPYIRTAKGLVSLGDTWLEAGRAHEAFGLWLDGIRLGQDLARGGTTWLEAMVAHAGAMILVERLHSTVDGASLTDVQLEELREDVVILVESEPHPRAHMLADRFYPLLYEVVPPLMPPTWEPPGGFPPDQARPERGPPDEQRRLLITWQTIERIADKQVAACPVDADVGTCIRGLEALTSRLVEAGKPNVGDALALASDPAAGSSELIASTLEAMVAPGWSKYLERQAQRRVALHALALRLGVRGGESCPEPGDPALVVPGLGEALRAEAGRDAVVLSAPPLVTRDEPLQWTVPCGHP